MIQDKDLQALVEYDATPKVLSVYLDTSLAAKSKDAARLMFRERSKHLAEAREDLQRVQRFLDHDYDWRARGLAIFAGGDALWLVVPLPVPVRTQAYYASKPQIRALTDIIDRFGSYGVALVDQERLKLYTVARGRIEPVLEMIGEEVRSYKQGGWSVRGGQRSAATTHGESNLAWRNLKQAAHEIQSFCSGKGPRHLVLGGSAEALGRIRDLLPNPLRERILGELVIDLDTPSDQILERSLDIAVQIDLAAEKQLVTQAVTAAAKGGAGVTGVVDTLSMLHQGRVHMLLVDEAFHREGCVCAHCGYVASSAPDACPLCAYKQFEATPDIGNVAIHKALAMGADVNIVRDNPELESAGGIAALLRY